MTFTVVFPWPSKVLSPNARPHWAVLMKARASYRHECHVLSLAEGAAAYGSAIPAGTKLHVHLDFYPPNKRSRDDANCMYAMKSAIDGLADGLGIDDKHFRTSYELLQTVAGMVRVTVRAVPDQPHQG